MVARPDRDVLREVAAALLDEDLHALVPCGQKTRVPFLVGGVNEQHRNVGSPNVPIGEEVQGIAERPEEKSRGIPTACRHAVMPLKCVATKTGDGRPAENSRRSGFMRVEADFLGARCIPQKCLIVDLNFHGRRILTQMQKKKVRQGVVFVPRVEADPGSPEFPVLALLEGVREKVVNIEHVCLGSPGRTAREQVIAVKRVVEPGKVLRKVGHFWSSADRQDEVNAEAVYQLPRVVWPVDRKQRVKPPTPDCVIEAGGSTAGLDVVTQQRPSNAERTIRHINAQRVHCGSSVGFLRDPRQAAACPLALSIAARSRQMTVDLDESRDGMHQR